MPNINDVFPSLEQLEPVQLHARYAELTSRGSLAALSDEDLHEICAILKALRRKSVGPPKAVKRPPAASKTVVATEDLL